MLNIECWISAIACWLLIAGCRTTPASHDAEADKPLVTHAQYTHSTPPDIGYNTLEIFITNPGHKTVTFSGGTLNGTALPSLESGNLALMARQFKVNLGGHSAPLPLPPADKRVTWWQFQPSPTLPPGATTVCQINFRTNYTATSTLQLQTTDNDTLSLTIPRFSQPTARIHTVTWSGDGKKMFVQYTAGNANLTTISLNAHPIRPSATLTAPGHPSIAVIPAPRNTTFTPKAPLLLDLQFSDGSRRCASLRPLTTIMLDAPHGWEHDKTLPAAIRETYSLDAHPAIAYLPFDVVCSDTRANMAGATALPVTAARHQAWRRQPHRLYGVEFCTARYAADWNIYTPIADAIFIKPYQLHWGPDPTLCIENEAAIITTAVSAAAPRPTVWIPERFKRERHVEGAEHSLLTWIALTSGIKGIRHHYWMNDPHTPFRDCPDLDSAIQTVNAQIRQLAPILAPLIPVSAKNDRTLNITIHEAWAGDNGILLLVRNMNYRTDGHANDSGKKPRLHVTPATDITLNLTLPPWLTPTPPTDPLSATTYPHTLTDNSLSCTLPQLENFRLIWIPNQSPTSSNNSQRR